VSTNLSKLLVEGCAVKRLTVAILVWNVFTPTVFAQTVDETQSGAFPGCVEIIRGTERHCITPLPSAQTVQQAVREEVFSSWLEIVRGAERHYRNKHGHYGDLAVLQNAHFLDSLVFESFVGSRGKAEANFVPKTTLFQVTVSKNGQHFKVVIGEHCGLNLVGEDMAAPRRGFSTCRVPASPYLPDLKDSPLGPIIGTAW